MIDPALAACFGGRLGVECLAGGFPTWREVGADDVVEDEGRLGHGRAMPLHGRRVRLGADEVVDCAAIGPRAQREEFPPQWTRLQSDPERAGSCADLPADAQRVDQEPWYVAEAV